MLLTGSIFAQGSEGEAKPLPAAPANHVLDLSDTFRENPTKLAELTATLKRIEEQHGYLVYLALYYNVLDGTVQSRADALYKAWLGDEKRGLVLVYQSDPAVDGKNIAASYYRGTGLADDAVSGLIPDQKMSEILRSALAAQSKGQDTSDRSITIVSGVEREMNEYFASDPSTWKDSANLKLMAIFFGVILALALLGMFLWKRSSTADVAAHKHYYFPDVDVASRLGAPYGGGWVSEKSFVPSASRK
ncbi:hypothetical protein NT6N_10570 [Oceaniferula spumae]|uniref:TPM domain-containing protein n=1 Tax=Oceaniferula spumae TaxID=2979115 RepID=A0AAT9FJ98_9BACT